jgi:hypothetical protein
MKLCFEIKGEAFQIDYVNGKEETFWVVGRESIRRCCKFEDIETCIYLIEELLNNN